MSIISILSPKKNQLIASKPLINVLHQIKSGLYEEEVKRWRQFGATNNESAAAIRNDDSNEELPWFSVAGHFKQRNGALELISYSGCMLLEFSYLNEPDLKSIQEQLRSQAQVMAFFRNALGTGLCFVVKTDCSMVEHTRGFWKVKSYFQELLGIAQLSVRGERLEYFCRFSWDADLYMNLEAEVSEVGSF